MSISMKHVWQLGIVIVVLGLLGLLALSIPHMLTHTTHVASPTFTYPPTNSKMVTDHSIGLLHGDPKGAQVVQTTVLPPPLDYQSSNIIPKQTKRKLLHSLFLFTQRHIITRRQKYMAKP